jgi:hypothetical protein
MNQDYKNQESRIKNQDYKSQESRRYAVIRQASLRSVLTLDSCYLGSKKTLYNE